MANVMPTMKSCIIFASFANFYYFCYIAYYIKPAGTCTRIRNFNIFFTQKNLT